MIGARKVTVWQSWCVLCRWTGDRRQRPPQHDREWEAHFRFFHLPDSAGHRPNGHDHANFAGRIVDDCVCGGSFDGGPCSNAGKFGFTLGR